VTLLVVRGLSAGYGDFQALTDVSLAVPEGELVAVIGANGAGKSTLLHALAGALPAAAGTVELAGRSVNGLPAETRVGLGLTLVPEGRRIFPSLSVEENLRVGAYRGRSGPWTLARVQELFSTRRWRPFAPRERPWSSSSRT
jgi:branched-chain amino acid transport system ATP-binding protein